MKIKKGLLIVGVIIVLGVLFANRMYNKPHISVKKTEAEISLNTSKIINDFSSDEAKANEKYLEKIIEVTGVVKEIVTENNKTILSLGNTENIESVMCHFTNLEDLKSKKIAVGKTIKVKGICTGYLLDVVLVKSVIVN